jgi:hypothetical protein
MGDHNPQQIGTASVLNISLVIDSPLAKEFYLLLQTGFTVKCLVGVSIENLFYDQLKLNPQLVEEKIRTIFLSGKPVDDIATATVQDGSTLALSGAMPGLVGATLRRKSPLASFRQSISAQQTSKNFKKTEGYIQIKLFNILLKELGLFFLEMGIYVPRAMFTSFIAQLTGDFYNRCRQILVNGEPVQLQSSIDWCPFLTNHDFVSLKVQTE